MSVNCRANGSQWQAGKAIAETLQVAEETISRWRQLPAFEAELNTLLQDARDAARERLRGLMGVALSTKKAQW